MRIRDETEADRLSIFRVHAAAFPSDGEARLVDMLRDGGDLTISLVAECEGTVVGHVAFSRMSAPFGALGLAPVGVLPRAQNRGIGTALIRCGIERAKSGAWDGVFVLGDAPYYERFGFRVDLAAGFSCRFAGPHFMAMALGGISLPQLSGAVAYPDAFDVLD
ncbi:MAG: N-acetyltransferase [Rhizomicrobium sp.]|jgi:putative acetyltransferase